MREGQQPYVAVHEQPVWRDRADFLIAADISADATGGEWEQLWSRRINETHFEICCIPFFAYDLALGDVVEAGPHAGREYVVRRVIKASGRLTFRVWFGHSRESGFQSNYIAHELASRDALLEWSSQDLLAVDAFSQEAAQVIADFLAEKEQSGELLYETGRTA